MKLVIKKHSDDPDNCREYFRAQGAELADGTTLPQLASALYCTVDGKMHSVVQESGEPLMPMRDDVEIVEVDTEGQFVKQWQLGVSGRYREWIATLSERMQAAIATEFCGPARCYRSKSNRGHYDLHSFVEPEDPNAPLTCTIIHGKDSYLPGVAAFGIPLTDLVICDCGNWEPPTPEQIEATGMNIAVAAAKRRGNTNAS